MVPIQQGMVFVEQRGIRRQGGVKERLPAGIVGAPGGYDAHPPHNSDGVSVNHE